MIMAAESTSFVLNRWITMPSALWSFTLDFYARPGVEQACLTLQANGANVCMVLCGVWLGTREVACNAQRLTQIRQLATPWHDEVVRPLRDLRNQWRNAALEDALLMTLRMKVKALELEAEQSLMLKLEALAGDWPAGEARSAEEWLIELADGEAEKNRDALQVLRVAVDLAVDQT
ncbi:hypothetical protein ALP33_04733 [Pseudomonas amygdali pv. lachrymans]|uniref:TIGR02444 family protein n=4 Tax=Pseudomonas amygdali TaxID=47877 RepID=A0AB34TYU2_PSEA0|nr:Uncharacterized protein ALO67_05084 [Pseudomonas amygdali pv. hibisci]RMM47070.1 hypothetical protein ALQ79_04919 [Pseudomonas amygdali pv. lachrymans]RMT17265.1 hypothetical protein ALP54_05656 [Pseudomonas amygdali pv. lachrymans]RMU21698.1 hypothetical protein ALP33_04733 [Pseudomonas amygdali pv. lachrymans]RMV50441.1 hypothetical protein ALP09_04408 [Pseudomonas amygdali pv. lachrymans]